MTDEELLTYYTVPSACTDLAAFADLVDALPDDIASVVRVVQGLVVHFGWAPLYRIALPPERVDAEKELCAASAIVGCAMERDARPLVEARAPGERVAGVCWHFAVLFAAILRHKGVPARVRAGFANYFERGKHMEHWVGEFWAREEHRWVLVDAQIDDVQAQIVRPDFDALDVPRARFLVAGDAWRACRSGAADPMTFGVAGTSNWGLLEVFGEVLLDLAAARKIELLPWRWYGLATEEGALDREVELMDRLAALSSIGDAAALMELRALVASDARLRAPGEPA